MRKLIEFLFGVSIKRRVVEIIEAKIKLAQERYDNELASLKATKCSDIQTVQEQARAKVEAIEDNFESDVSGLAGKHVREALSNLL